MISKSFAPSSPSLHTQTVLLLEHAEFGHSKMSAILPEFTLGYCCRNQQGSSETVREALLLLLGHTRTGHQEVPQSEATL